jgi:hypothetical protein
MDHRPKVTIPEIVAHISRMRCETASIRDVSIATEVVVMNGHPILQLDSPTIGNI